MARITWKLGNGETIEADVEEGTSLMAAATAHNVPRVLGECGGCLACATCHVYVTADWQARTGAPDADEDAMLDATEAERQPNSRLSCQMMCRDDWDGLVLEVPDPMAPQP